MTHFCTKTCITAQTPRLTLIFFGKRQWHVFLLIGRLMVTKGYGSPPSLAPGQNYGSGWLTVRKHHLGMAGDAFIEPVKLTKAMS